MSDWTASQGNSLHDIREALSRPRRSRPVHIVSPATYAKLLDIARREGLLKDPSAEHLERMARYTAAIGEDAMLLIFGQAVHRVPLDYIGAARALGGRRVLKLRKP